MTSKARDIADLGSNDVLETSSTGLDVTGTVTADGLAIGTSTLAGADLHIGSAQGTEQSMLFSGFGTDKDGGIKHSNGAITVATGGNNTGIDALTDRVTIGSNGDVSFFEDTGTTAKMVWSSSAEQLDVDGAVTSSELVVTKGSSNDNIVQVFGGGTIYHGVGIDGQGVILTAGSTGSADSELKFRVSSVGSESEAMRIDSSGNVGIGTASPSANLSIKGSTGFTGLDIADGSDRTIMQYFTTDGFRIANVSAKPIIFKTSDIERARLDSSGNLLVGTTSKSAATGQYVAHLGTNISSQELAICSYQKEAAIFNRISTDGDLVHFRKDGSTVGSIGVDSGNEFYITDNSNTGLRFSGGGNVNIIPCDSNGATRDNAIDLGYDAGRFDDIYATNGTIQTSDRNEKQDIEVLSDAEQRVAQACKGLLRKFRWKDSVAEKGDEARIHFGIIAQDLQDAFTVEGLDAGRYAMFISSTWTDEETGEERTRLGVRYPELLAFIISAL